MISGGRCMSIMNFTAQTAGSFSPRRVQGEVGYIPDELRLRGGDLFSRTGQLRHRHGRSDLGRSDACVSMFESGYDDAVDVRLV